MEQVLLHRSITIGPRLTSKRIEAVEIKTTVDKVELGRMKELDRKFQEIHQVV